MFPFWELPPSVVPFLLTGSVFSGILADLVIRDGFHVPSIWTV